MFLYKAPTLQHRTIFRELHSLEVFDVHISDFVDCYNLLNMGAQCKAQALLFGLSPLLLPNNDVLGFVATIKARR